MAQHSDRSSASRRGLPILPFPIDDPLAALPVTAQKILGAAQRLLSKGGYEEVTLEKVAAEAGVNKASIRYNFGDKAGLLAALVDLLMHAEFARMTRDAPSLRHEERLDASIEAKRRMILSSEAFRGFFDILPHALRNRELRERIAALYPWWCEQNLTWLGLQGGGPQDRDAVVQGLGELLSAVVDGLSVQAALEPEFDPARPLETLKFLMANSMAQLAQRATGQGDSRGASATAPSSPAKAKAQGLGTLNGPLLGQRFRQNQRGV